MNMHWGWGRRDRQVLQFCTPPESLRGSWGQMCHTDCTGTGLLRAQARMRPLPQSDLGGVSSATVLCLGLFYPSHRWED